MNVFTNVYALAECTIGQGISVPVPPPPPFPDQFLKLPVARQRPLQKRILEYLSQGGWPSVNAISTDLDVWRFSARRCLEFMKSRGLVEDEWVWFMPGSLPDIKAHTFHITDLGWRELKFMQSIPEATESYPLGYRILLYMSHGQPMTVGQIAKMLGEDRGHVGRVIKSLHRAGLVDCLYSKTRTSFGQDMITHLHRITELGQEVPSAGPRAYLSIARSNNRSMRKLSGSEHVERRSLGIVQEQ